MFVVCQENLADSGGSTGRLTRRRFAAGIVGTTAASVHIPMLAQGVSSIELTDFILRDIEFKLLTWMPPSTEARAFDDWIKSMESSLHRLMLVSREGGLDQQVDYLIQRVGMIVDVYRQLLRGLEIVDIVHDTVAFSTQGSFSKAVSDMKKGYQAGYDFGMSTARFLAAASTETFKAVATNGFSIAFTIAESLMAAQRQATRANMRQAQKQRLLEGAKGQLHREVGYLVDTGMSLQSRIPSLRVPQFRRLYENSEYRLRSQDTPFAHAADAYRLLATDRIGAARKFGETANQMPAGVMASPTAAAYVASFHLVAGHVLEFESRVRGDPKLCVEALRYFDQADALLRGMYANESPVAYPYQIARARAFAVTGQSDRCIALVRRMQETLEKEDAQAVAERSYDLAGVYSLMGRHDQAMEQLRRSYLAVPRRDPQALNDPVLKDLVSRHLRPAREIVDSPLVGSWASSSGSRYIFYPDGSFWQRRPSGEYSGKWAIRNGQVLELSLRVGVPDASPRFEVNGDTLTLYAEGTFTYSRVTGGLLNGKTARQESDRRVMADGRWAWIDGRPASFARFTTSSSVGRSVRGFWYSYEDPTIGRISELSERE